MIMLSFISVHVEFSRMYLTFYKLLLNIAVACMWGSENKKKTFLLLLIIDYQSYNLCKALIRSVMTGCPDRRRYSVFTPWFTSTSLLFLLLHSLSQNKDFLTGENAPYASSSVYYLLMHLCRVCQFMKTANGTVECKLSDVSSLA